MERGAAVSTGELQEQLTGLARLVAGARTRVPPTGAADGRRQRLAWHLEEYLLPRVRDLEAPLVAVLLGSTGAGKSSLLNGLAGAQVSPSGVVRPTTRQPVALVTPGGMDAFGAGRVLPALAGRGLLRVVTGQQARPGFPGVVLVDAPDLDSVETANRALADELLQAADLCIFVTTAQRYADLVPWEFLHRARARGVPLLVVVNRLPASAQERDEILEDCRRRFAEAGLEAAGPGSGGGPGPTLVVGIAEGARDGAVDGIAEPALAPVRAALARLSSDAAAMLAVKAQGLRGALEGLPARAEEVARDLELDARRAEGLREPVRHAYRQELARLEGRLASGDFLRGEVMRSWQEFVGSGDVARWLSSGVGRVRAWLASRFREPTAGPPLEHAKEQAFDELVAAVVRHADAAAARAASSWAADPAGAALLERHPELWGHGPDLPEASHRLLAGWLGRLTGLVRERGHSRRAFAFTASLGVNAIGVVAMLTVFAQTAGLTGGEVAIAGGTAVVNQKLLEALIGEAAVADIVRAARRDLHATLEGALRSDAGRFLGLLEPAGVEPAALRAVVREVVGAAERVLAGLGAR